MHEIARTILPGELVFDIGAHVGDKTNWFVERGARVVAVEPQPRVAETLRARFEGRSEIVVVQKGLAQAPGTMTMSIEPGAPVLSTFADKWKEGRFRACNWSERVEVEMTTLDDLVAAHGIPRYCKVDVEGFEKQVMLGLTRRIGAISLEFTAEFMNDTRDLLWYAAGLGYRQFNLSLGEAEHFLTDRWMSVEESLERLAVVCGAEDLAWGDVYVC